MPQEGTIMARQRVSCSLNYATERGLDGGATTAHVRANLRARSPQGMSAQLIYGGLT